MRSQEKIQDSVIPANAGIHFFLGLDYSSYLLIRRKLDSRFRGNDVLFGLRYYSV
jgi:hypothetical protein